MIARDSVEMTPLLGASEAFGGEVTELPVTLCNRAGKITICVGYTRELDDSEATGFTTLGWNLPSGPAYLTSSFPSLSPTLHPPTVLDSEWL